jgi:hypothetical protein
MTRDIRLLVAALSLTATACVSPTEGCTSMPLAPDAWEYRATQDAPPGPTFAGTLRITGTSCRDFSGLLDVMETDAGVSRRIAGPVSGVMLDSLTARFSVALGVMEREHIARFTADSMTGSWVEHGGPSAAYGRFSGWRSP